MPQRARDQGARDRRRDRGRTGRIPGRPGQRARDRLGDRLRNVSAGQLPRPRLTSRAAVLVVVLAVLAVSYASSLRAYLEQRSHLAALEEQISASEENIASLEREKRRWDDEAYVISQARARFAFGFPGETGYQVLDEDGEPLDHEDTLSAPKELDVPEWWETTVDSIEAAGNGATEKP
jgi:cell division protein FtsB